MTNESDSVCDDCILLRPKSLKSQHFRRQSFPSLVAPTHNCKRLAPLSRTTPASQPSPLAMKATELVMRATQPASIDGSMDDLAASAVVRMLSCCDRVCEPQLACPASSASLPPFSSSPLPLTPLQLQIACLTNDPKRIKEGVAAIKMRLKTGHGKSRVLGAPPHFPALQSRIARSRLHLSRPTRRPMHARLRQCIPRRCCSVSSLSTRQGERPFILAI